MALQVGGETKAYCTSCRAMRDHIIVAMMGEKPAKVECDICHKQHLFRAGPPGAASATRTTRPRATAKSRAAAAAAPTIDLAEKVAGREAVPYQVSHRFASGDVVRHPTFGVGLVTAVPGPQKMEVLFEAGAKLLSHDRAAPSTAPPLSRPVRREDEGPRQASDAPPRAR